MQHSGFIVKLIDLFVWHQGLRHMKPEGPSVGLKWVIDPDRVLKDLTRMDYLGFKKTQHGFIEGLNLDISERLFAWGDEVSADVGTRRSFLLFFLILYALVLLILLHRGWLGRAS